MQDAVITGFFGTPASGQAAEANGWNGAQGGDRRENIVANAPPLTDPRSPRGRI